MPRTSLTRLSWIILVVASLLGPLPPTDAALTQAQYNCAKAWYDSVPRGTLTAPLKAAHKKAEDALAQDKANRDNGTNKRDHTPIADANLDTPDARAAAGGKAPYGLWVGGKVNKADCKFSDNTVNIDFTRLKADLANPKAQMYNGALILIEEFYHDTQPHGIRAYLKKQGFEDVDTTKAPPDQDADGDGDQDADDLQKMTDAVTLIGAAVRACDAFSDADGTAQQICNFFLFCPNPGAGGTVADQKWFCLKLKQLCDFFMTYCNAFDKAVADWDAGYAAFGTAHGADCQNSMTVTFCKKGGGTKAVTFSLKTINDKVQNLKAEKAKLKQKVADAKAAIATATPWK